MNSLQVSFLLTILPDPLVPGNTLVRLIPLPTDTSTDTSLVDVRRPYRAKDAEALAVSRRLGLFTRALTRGVHSRGTPIDANKVRSDLASTLIEANALVDAGRTDYRLPTLIERANGALAVHAFKEARK